MSVFGKRLKSERELKKDSDPKWTQGYVANIVGVARPTYTAYENGTKEPPLDTLNRIADLFEISIDYLQGRTDNRHSATDEIDKKINIAYIDGVKHELTPEIAKRLKDDIKMFEELKAKWKKEQRDK